MATKQRPVGVVARCRDAAQELAAPLLMERLRLRYAAMAEDVLFMEGQKEPARVRLDMLDRLDEHMQIAAAELAVLSEKIKVAKAAHVGVVQKGGRP